MDLLCSFFVEGIYFLKKKGKFPGVKNIYYSAPSSSGRNKELIQSKPKLIQHKQ